MKKQINPEFVAVFPPLWTEAPSGLPTIGRQRPFRTARLVSLEAYGAPDLQMIVNSVLQKTAYRTAIMWARLKHYGPTRRITAIKIQNIYP